MVPSSKGSRSLVRFRTQSTPGFGTLSIPKQPSFFLGPQPRSIRVIKSLLLQFLNASYFRQPCTFAGILRSQANSAGEFGRYDSSDVRGIHLSNGNRLLLLSQFPQQATSVRMVRLHFEFRKNRPLTI